jgi:magnesium-transporting ATPase (P-type)
VARGPEAGTPTLLDPLRPDAAQLIAELRALGVDVKMLTGDALPVALEISKSVGLPNIRHVDELKAASAMAGTAPADLLSGVDGFAEV